MTARDQLIRLRQSLVAAMLLRGAAFGAAIAIAGFAVALTLRLPGVVAIVVGISTVAGTAVGMGDVESDVAAVGSDPLVADANATNVVASCESGWRFECERN